MSSDESPCNVRRCRPADGAWLIPDATRRDRADPSEPPPTSPRLRWPACPGPDRVQRDDPLALVALSAVIARLRGARGRGPTAPRRQRSSTLGAGRPTGDRLRPRPDRLPTPRGVTCTGRRHRHRPGLGPPDEPRDRRHLRRRRPPRRRRPAARGQGHDQRAEPLRRRHRPPAAQHRDGASSARWTSGSVTVDGHQARTRASTARRSSSRSAASFPTARRPPSSSGSRPASARRSPARTGCSRAPTASSTCTAGSRGSAASAGSSGPTTATRS